MSRHVTTQSVRYLISRHVTLSVRYLISRHVTMLSVRYLISRHVTALSVRYLISRHVTTLSVRYLIPRHVTTLSVRYLISRHVTTLSVRYLISRHVTTLSVRYLISLPYTFLYCCLWIVRFQQNRWLRNSESPQFLAKSKINCMWCFPGLSQLPNLKSTHDLWFTYHLVYIFNVRIFILVVSKSHLSMPLPILVRFSFRICFMFIPIPCATYRNNHSVFWESHNSY
jgi:hypothetical protein